MEKYGFVFSPKVEKQTFVPRLVEKRYRLITTPRCLKRGSVHFCFNIINVSNYCRLSVSKLRDI
jgi:hypothetical protein